MRPQQPILPATRGRKGLAGTLFCRPLLAEELEIGFDWLCFPTVPGGTYFDKYPIVKMLRQYGPEQIGFVLHNR